MKKRTYKKRRLGKRMKQFSLLVTDFTDSYSFTAGTLNFDKKSSEAIAKTVRKIERKRRFTSNPEGKKQ